MELSNTEQGPDFYDSKIELKHFEYQKPRLFDPAADFLPPPYGCPTIVDLGCGVGHFARILFDRGYERYIGIDFSQMELVVAKKQVPQFCFRCADLRNVGLLKTLRKFKIFVCFEVLEHITEDLKILENLQGGLRLYFPSRI